MRASEFMEEEQLNEIAPLIAAGARVLAPMALRTLGTMAARGLGGAASRGLGSTIAGKLGGVAYQTSKTLSSPIGKTMSNVISKGVSNVAQKMTNPPQPGTVGTTQATSKPVAKGDTIDNPALGGQVKVKNVMGSDVELEMPALGPKATLKIPKSDLGVR